MLELTYLGVAGWHFRTARHSLLIDPYFTRLSMRQVMLTRAEPNQAIIAAHTPPADSIFVTHPHYDHLMDVPDVARITQAQVYASAQGGELLRVLGVSQVNRIQQGDVIACGDFTIEVYESQHRAIFGGIPYYGALRAGLQPPLRAREYRMDVQFSFRVTAGAVSVVVASGIDDEPLVSADVLLVGADASPQQLAAILEAVKPRLVLPNHWDDMFIPLSAPIRPMIVPPPGRIPRWQRIDLDGFTRIVHHLAPAAQVLIPQRFEAVLL